MWSVPFWFLLAAFVVFGRPRRRWRRERRSELASSERENDIQLLEVRLARLEERLDFTEKLLAGRAPTSD